MLKIKRKSPLQSFNFFFKNPRLNVKVYQIKNKNYNEEYKLKEKKSNLIKNTHNYYMVKQCHSTSNIINYRIL